jgi:membrane associated rhomboid family serine protease
MIMGIYDREYYRREGPSFLSTFAAHGKICKWLVGINVVVFVLQLVLRNPHDGSDPVTQWFVLDVNAVFHGELWRLLTYAFLHSPANIWHILFNMWILWVFGPAVEDIYGASEFLVFYLVSALLGGVAFTLTNLGGGAALGASGAVTATLVLYALHFPRQTVLLMFVIPVPVWLLVAGSVLMDAFVFVSRQHTGVAVTVHLGSALFAFVYYKRHWRLSPPLLSLQRWFKHRHRPALRVYRGEAPEPVHASIPAVSENEEPLEAKLDRVLEKVASHGQSSLSDDERQILLRASEIYRKRRS